MIGNNKIFCKVKFDNKFYFAEKENNSSLFCVYYKPDYDGFTYTGNIVCSKEVSLLNDNEKRIAKNLNIFLHSCKIVICTSDCDNHSIQIGTILSINGYNENTNKFRCYILNGTSKDDECIYINADACTSIEFLSEKDLENMKIKITPISSGDLVITKAHYFCVCTKEVANLVDLLSMEMCIQNIEYVIPKDRIQMQIYVKTFLTDKNVEEKINSLPDSAFKESILKSYISYKECVSEKFVPFRRLS